MFNTLSKKHLKLIIFLTILICFINVFIGCDKAAVISENSFDEVLQSQPDKDINYETAVAYAPNTSLEGKSVSHIMNMPIRYNENDLFFSKWLETENMSVTKYSFVDLDSDSNPETVLWLAKEANEYFGFLILHEEDETVYLYLLYYRQFYNLKNDGTFSSSGGVANNGIRKISFSGLTYTENDIAYCESYDNNNISYFVEGETVSQEEYNMYLIKQEEKSDAVWNVYQENAQEIPH